MKQLKPLTPEQEAEFESNRISDAVVQHKCANCGAWYETSRGTIDQKEEFVCENLVDFQMGLPKICGQKLTYPVPAMTVKSQIITASNQDVLSLQDGADPRLDTGMKASEAIHRAEQWWQKIGRKQMKREKKRQATQVGGADKGMGGSFASNNPDDKNFLPSGILHGEQWDALTKREKLMIVKTWHHFNVRVPDVLGGNVDAEFQIKDRDTIH